ncbi:MAG: hypothetical protein NC344_07815 [Bacteroidales bacterium]|nr:hypothetical protein [Bacteroidales bacterium]MCM1147720.1 hypothetical protein [Bacteroidales bacterium]MCM1206670.1 hypothetical protein [Bacillota bacterium]MCM1510589.1 hypothetical protein [Clostridium sp.]
MRKLFILSLLCVLTVCVCAKKSKTAKPSAKYSTTIYMFGVSASFNDSTVYFTDVQEVDSAYLVRKVYLGGFRSYSDQMNSYFQSKTGERRTNTVYFKKQRARAEKTLAKLRKRYANSGVVMQTVPASEFTFQGVRPNGE